MMMVAEAPSSEAARATPCAWLPALAATTPCARSAADMRAIRTYAPRILNEPARCRFSHLRKTGPPAGADSTRQPSSGVRRTTPSRISRASWTSVSDTSGTAAAAPGGGAGLTPPCCHQRRRRTVCAMQDLHPLAGTDVVVPAGDDYGLEAPLRMHVVEHGRRDGMSVLLLHGLPTTSYLWRDVARDLGHDHLCLMPDLIGLGNSEKPLQRRPYALDAQARVVLGALDTLHVDRLVAVGHDLGGAVAVHLAALAPQRVAGIALIDSPVHAEVWPVPSVLPLLTPGIAQAEVGVLRRTPGLARKVLARSLGSTL